MFCQPRFLILLSHLSCLAFPHSKALGIFGHTGSWTWKTTLKVHLVADVEMNICVKWPLFLKTSGSWVSQGSTPWLAPRKVLRLTQDPFFTPQSPGYTLPSQDEAGNTVIQGHCSHSQLFIDQAHRPLTTSTQSLNRRQEGSFIACSLLPAETVSGTPLLCSIYFSLSQEADGEISKKSGCGGEV